jgi:hypothetical protein
MEYLLLKVEFVILPSKEPSDFEVFTYIGENGKDFTRVHKRVSKKLTPKSCNFYFLVEDPIKPGNYIVFNNEPVLIKSEEHLSTFVNPKKILASTDAKLINFCSEVDPDLKIYGIHPNFTNLLQKFEEILSVEVYYEDILVFGCDPQTGEWKDLPVRNYLLNSYYGFTKGRITKNKKIIKT